MGHRTQFDLHAHFVFVVLMRHTANRDRTTDLDVGMFVLHT